MTNGLKLRAAVLLVVVWVSSVTTAQEVGGTILVISDPSTRVFIDREFIGMTSKETGRLRINAVRHGIHEIGVDRVGFVPKDSTVAVIEGRVAEIDLTGLIPIAPPPKFTAPDPENAGRLIIHSFPIACTITCETLGLTAKAKVQNPLVLNLMKAGKHKIVFNAMGEAVNFNADIKAGETQVIVADFHFGKARLHEDADKTPEPKFKPGKKPDKATEIAGFTLMRQETITCGPSTKTVAIYRSDTLAKALGLAADESSVDVEFALLPGGSFIMGSPPSSQLADGDETQRTVQIQSFLIGLSEVTQRVWRAIAPGTGLEPEPSAMYGSDLLPVHMVTWEECEKLSKAAGMRLPTEEEWEYACRAGTGTNWCMADRHDTLPEFAWYSSQPKRFAHDVAGLRPNAFGLYDVHGNIGEWCSTVFSANGMVHRGGAYGDDSTRCRSANRFWAARGVKFESIGLRLAATLP